MVEVVRGASTATGGAYERGRRAFVAGKLATDNPYPDSERRGIRPSSFRKAWQRGYEDARAEARDG